MPIPEAALLTADEAEGLKSQMGNYLQNGVRYWRPLHARMDSWASMYFLLDVVQQAKPPGYRRFVSNEPRTAIDAAVSILTRNEAYWRIPLNQILSENAEERERVGRVERSLQGIVNDIDEMFSSRYDMPLWKQAAFFALLYGSIWGKFHVTEDALAFRDSPLLAEVYDPRLVLPHFDSYGLNYVLIQKPVTVGALEVEYPQQVAEILKRMKKDPREDKKNSDPNAPALKIEYWSNNRPNRPGITGTLGILSPSQARGAELFMPDLNPASVGKSAWLIPPYKHGYTPRTLPVVGVPVNGVPVRAKPGLSRAVSAALSQRADSGGVSTALWQGPDTWIAETCRGILSAVEDEVPQYNEMVATILHHFSLNAFGTWFFKSPTGVLPNVDLGIEARVPLMPEESVERISPQPISPDAYRILDIMQDEQQKGTLSSILRATLPQGGGGELGSSILFQQMTSAALNALEPFHDGLEQFGTRMGTSLLGQLQDGAKGGVIKKFTVAFPGPRSTFFEIEFDPKLDLERGRQYRAVPIFKPALPDDMHIRIQTARIALDPRRPLLSLVTVLERIIQIEDPSGEIDRIWEDIANTDPVIVMEQIAMALDKLGEEEMAARVRETQFRAKAEEDLKFRQMNQNVPQLGAPPGPGPETGAPEATQRTGTAADQVLREMVAEGGQLVGAAGERGPV